MGEQSKGWLKKAGGFGVGGGTALVILLGQMDSKVESAQANMRQYVDAKHEAVIQRLDGEHDAVMKRFDQIDQILEKIDKRVYELKGGE